MPAPHQITIGPVGPILAFGDLVPSTNFRSAPDSLRIFESKNANRPRVGPVFPFSDAAKTIGSTGSVLHAMGQEKTNRILKSK
jgi:hypothetical protein